MGLTLNLNNLASRITRSSVVSGGIRRFSTSALSDQQDSNGNIIGKLWNGFTRFGGFLIGKVVSLLGTAVKFSWSLLWGLTTSTLQFIWNFNWNASDAELDASIQNAFAALGGTLGGTLGNALGWLACGALPGAVVFAFNEPMGLYILKNVGEEALDEIAGNIANLIRQTGISLIRASVTFLYKNIRRLWREPDSKVRAKMKAAGVADDKIDSAIAERNKPWSFASQFESFIEGLPDGFIQNFAEEFFEEFSDSCVEAGYVVANSADSYLAAQRLAADSIFGEETTVEILLNRGTDSTASSTSSS